MSAHASAKVGTETSVRVDAIHLVGVCGFSEGGREVVEIMGVCISTNENCCVLHFIDAFGAWEQVLGKYVKEQGGGVVGAFMGGTIC